jgi:VWFA-related protein
VSPGFWLNILVSFGLIFAPSDCPTQVSPGKPSATFGTNVNVVTVPVVVRDPSGRAVGNLTKQDFQILDKGKQQVIDTFSVEGRAGAVSAPEVSAAQPGLADARDSEQTLKVSANKPSHAERYVAYLFDDRDITFADMARVRAAARQHFASIPATDRAAVYTFSGRATLGFSSDKAKLDQVLGKLELAVGQGHDYCPWVTYYLADLIITTNDQRALDAVTRQTMDCAHADYTHAQWLAMTAVRKELLIGAQDTRIALASLKATILRMSELQGQRSIVLASPGFFPRTVDERSALGAVMDLAAKNNVMISTLDVRGVYTTGLGDASHWLAPTSSEEKYYYQSADASGDVLEDLAQATGGTYFHANNDLVTGFERTSAAPEVYYVLSFSPAALKPDGSFHALKIRLTDRKDLSIQSRHGYFAAKAGGASSSPEDQIRDSIFSRDEVTALPVDVAAQVSKSGAEESRLLVLAKVHAACLHFRRKGGRNRDSLTVVMALFNNEGDYVEGSTKSIDLSLRDETLAGVNARADAGVNVQSVFAMKPGPYLLRVVVHDAGGKTMSAHSVAVAVR